MSDEAIKLGLDTGDASAQSAKLKAKLNEIEAEIKELNDAFQRGSIGLGAYESAMKKLEAQSRATAGAMDKMGKKAQGAGSEGAMGLMLMAQTIDDAQYGFRAIVNNIPMVAAAGAQAMGMQTAQAMKFGGAMGIVAVAINQVIQHWDDFVEAGHALEGDLEPIVGLFDDIGASIKKAFDGTTLDSFVENVQWAVGEAITELKRYNEEKARGDADAKQAKENKKEIDKVTDKKEQDRGKAAKEALEIAGGGDAARQKIIGQMTGNLKQADLDKEVRVANGRRMTKREKIAEDADKLIKSALDGKDGAAEHLSKLLGGSFLKDFHENTGEGKKAKKAEDKAAARQEKKDTTEYTTNLEKRFSKAMLEGKDVSRDHVKDTLMTSQGLSEKEAEAIADEVHKNLGEGLKKALRKKAASEGISILDARKELLDEMDTKEEKKNGTTKREKELAKSIQTPLQEEHMGGKAVDRNRVKRELMASQELPEEDAEKYVDGVLKNLNEGMMKAIHKRAAEKNMSLQEAAEDLLKDARKKRQRKEEAEAAHKESEANADVSRARKQYAGVDKDTEKALVLAQLKGSSAEDAGKAVAEQLSKALQEKGFTKEEADESAKRIVAEDQEKLRAKLDDADKAAFDKKVERMRRAPETVGAAEFTNKVQSAVNTDRDKLYKVNELMLEQLRLQTGYARELERNGVGARVT